MTQGLARCTNKAGYVFCTQHRRQWVGFLLFAISIVGATYAIIQETHEHVQEPEVFLDLSRDAAIERQLWSSSKHEYTVDLKRNEYLHVEVEQRGVDVTVKLIGPNGDSIIEVDRSTGNAGSESLSYVASEPAAYQLVISPWKPTSSGNYVLKARALRQATEQDLLRAEAEQRYAVAEALRRAGDPSAALEQYQAALSSFEDSSHTPGQAVTLYRIGLLHEAQGKGKLALEPIRAALEKFRDLNDERMTVAALNSLGRAHQLLGEPILAHQYYSQSLDYAKLTGDPRTEAISLNNLAQLYSSLNEPSRALDLFRESLEIWHSLGDLRNASATLNSLGFLYINIHRLNDAGAAFTDSWRYSRSLGDRRREATALEGLGGLSRMRGELQESVRHLSQAIKLRRQSGDPTGEAIALTHMGSTLYDDGRQSEALNANLEASSLSRDTGDLSTHLNALANTCWLYQEAGEHEESTECYDRALALARTLGDRQKEATVLHGNAVLCRERGDLLQSLHLSQEALAIRERTLGDHAAASRASLLPPRQEVDGFFVDLLMQLYRRDSDPQYFDMAFEASERLRMSSLVERGASLGSILKRERLAIEVINEREIRRVNLAGSSGAAEEIEALDKELKSLRAELELARSNLKELDLEFEASTWSHGISLGQLQKEILDQDTQLLYYNLGEERSFLWLVSARSYSVYELPPKSRIESVARQANRVFSMSNRRESQLQVEAIAAELSNVLVRPLLGSLNLKKLVVITDGPLQYVPFAALRLPANGGRLLLEEHVIVQLPAIGLMESIRERQNRAPPPKMLALITDPVFSKEDSRLSLRPNITERTDPVLSEAMRSIGLSDLRRVPWLEAVDSTIMESMPAGATSTLSGFAASRENVLSGMLRQFRIVHFATHTLLNDEIPELSGLVLSQFDERGRPKAGLLRKKDVLRLELNADLVVLSGCSTALTSREGPTSLRLPDAMLLNGAARVLLNLWSVNDSTTKEFTTRFYRSLASGISPAESLRNAQIQMLNDGFEAPYFWGAFIMRGEWN